MFLGSTRTGNADIYISTRTDPNNDFGWSTPVNLGAPLNSELEDLFGTYFEDPTTGARMLIFSSNRVGNPATDYHVYQSTRNMDGTFNAPILNNELSSPMGNGGELRSAISRDGLEIFVATARDGVPGGFGVFDIWRSTRASTASAWNAPSPVPGVESVDDKRNPSLSPDGSILYFSSSRAGGSGGVDLYAANRCSAYLTTPCINRTPSADFDGDGQTDLGIFRPSDGTWWVMQSGTNTVSVRQFGVSGDKIVPADYDGDGRTDLAVFRPSAGAWWILPSLSGTAYSISWGISTDRPVPGDYDSDGKTDFAVYRGGTWYILQSSNAQLTQQQFGTSSDIPIAAAD
ncbi:MAG: VCBS repeat-containing protein [Acidobacteriota bacterium]